MGAGESKGIAKGGKLKKNRGKRGKFEEVPFSDIINIEEEDEQQETVQSLKSVAVIETPVKTPETLWKDVVPGRTKKHAPAPPPPAPAIVAPPSKESSSESHFTDPLQTPMSTTIIDFATEMNECYCSEESMVVPSSDTVLSDAVPEIIAEVKLDEWQRETLRMKMARLRVCETAIFDCIESTRTQDVEGGDITTTDHALDHCNNAVMPKRTSESNLQGIDHAPQKCKRNLSLSSMSITTNLQQAASTPNDILKKLSSTTSLAGLELNVVKPMFVPEKLDFKLYEKFEGHMLINWLVSELRDGQYMHLTNTQDLKVFAAQFCTHLLAAGVLKQIEDKDAPMLNIFKPDLMYYWTHSEAPQPVPETPGRLNQVAWPPMSPLDANVHIANHKSEVMPVVVVAQRNDVNSPNTPEVEQARERKLAAKEADILYLEEENRRLMQEIDKYTTLIEIQALTARTVEDFSSPVKEVKGAKSPSDVAKPAPVTHESLEYIRSESVVRGVCLACGGKFPFTKQEAPFDTEKQTTAIPTVLSNTIPVPPPLPDQFPVEELGPPSNSAKLATKRCDSPPDSGNKTIGMTQSCPAAPPPPPLPFSMSAPTCPPPPPPLPFSFSTPAGPPPPPPLPSSMSTPSCPPPPPPLPFSHSTPAGPPPPPPLPFSMSTPSCAPPPPPLPFSISGPTCPPPPPLPDAPPPPPMLGCGIPKPPPISGSSGAPPPPPPPLMVPGLRTLPGMPPPPPPPGPGGPAPLPAPPAGGWAANKAGLRKAPINPSAPMKPLYWTRIISTTQTTPTSNTADTIDQGASIGQPLWSQLDEVHFDDNLKEFTSLFSRQVTSYKTSKKQEQAKKPKKSEAMKLLDSKRSQNVGILAQSLHVDFVEIENAIYNFDTSVVSLEALEQIYESRATTDELQLIKEHLTNKPEVQLDKPEQFLHDLSEISSFAERIACFMFIAEFDDAITTIEHTLSNIKTTCNFLITSSTLKEVMAIILTLGNYMNGGNMTRGQADGFGLEILSKLRDVKSNDTQITLLHYTIRMYIGKVDGPLIVNQSLPIPEPGDISRAATVNFDDVDESLKRLGNKLKSCESRAHKVIASSSPDNLHPFKEKMAEFIANASKRLQCECDNLSECKAIFIRTMKFYQFRPKTGSIEQFPPNDFFELWRQFCLDFKDIWKKELLRIEKEKMKDLKKKFNQRISNDTAKTSFAPKTENNLKAKIGRTKNRLEQKFKLQTQNNE